MALYNESLVGRFNKLITQLHGIKGPGAPAPQVTPEIGHNVILENDRFEHRYLGGVNSYEAVGFTAAGVALNGAVGLRNPTGSGALVVVRGIAPVPAAVTTRFTVLLR